MKIKTLLFLTAFLSVSLNLAFVCEIEDGNIFYDTQYENALSKPADNFSQYHINMGYWNDNFITRRILGKEVSQGEDDHITASFWFQFSIRRAGSWWILDMYQNTLTNKSRYYRTDLLTLRLSIEKQTSLGSIRLGSGIIANNNFGGRAIQNGYHKLFGIDPVILPYTEKNKMGMIGFFRYNSTLWSIESVRLNGFFSNSYRSSVGPSNLKAGVECDISTHTCGSTPFFRLQTQMGYIDNYRTGKYISGMFYRGFTWGVLVSRSVQKKCHVSLWITSNQYGMNQPHFGLAFSYGVNENRMTDLADIEFP